MILHEVRDAQKAWKTMSHRRRGEGFEVSDRRPVGNRPNEALLCARYEARIRIRHPASEMVRGKGGSRSGHAK